MESPRPTFLRCVSCGSVSKLTDLYDKGSVCPRCAARPPRDLSLRAAFRVIALIFVLVAGELVGGWSLASEWVFGVFVLPVLLIFLHEISHALAGWVTGARIFEVRLGWRRPFGQVRLGRFRLTLARGFLRGGYCVAAYLTRRPSRWRYAVLYGTPMTLHLLALCWVAPYAWPLWPFGWEHCFFGYNVLLLLASARPIDYSTGTYPIPNDGKALLLLRTEAAEWHRTGFVLPALYALADGDRDQALAYAWRAEGMFPDDPAVGRALFTAYWALGCYADALRFLQHFPPPEEADPERERIRMALGGMAGKRYERWLHCVVCLHGGAYGSAVEEAQKGLEEEQLTEGRALWLALLAYACALQNENLDQAFHDAREAFELLPWVSFVCDTYAAVLVQRGDVEKGLLLMYDADALDQNEQEHCHRNAWRAIAYARRKRFQEARGYLARARSRGLELGAPPALLARAEEACAEN